MVEVHLTTSGNNDFLRRKKECLHEQKTCRHILVSQKPISVLYLPNLSMRIFALSTSSVLIALSRNASTVRVATTCPFEPLAFFWTTGPDVSSSPSDTTIVLMPPFTMIKRRASLRTSAGALGQSLGLQGVEGSSYHNALFSCQGNNGTRLASAWFLSSGPPFCCSVQRQIHYEGVPRCCGT